MKTVFIYAYTANNFGDDLFIYILCKRYRNTHFVLYAPKIYQEIFKHISNLKVIPSDTFSHKIRRLFDRMVQHKYKQREKIAQHTNLSVYIGGSLFIEQSDWQEEVKNIQSMMKFNQPFFIIGANFGPFKTERFINTYNFIFSKCTDVCFRDEHSYKLFRHLPNVRKASDVVFQLEFQKPITAKEYIVISVIKPSIREYLSGYDDIYYEQIKNICLTYIDAGYEVMLVGFCSTEKDHKAIEQIISLIPEQFHSALKAYNYKINMDKLLNILANSKAIVATRFHAMILGFLFQKPTFPIIYNEKMTALLDDLKFSGNYWKIINMEQIQLENFLAFHRNKAPDITEEISLADQQFLVLDKYLTHKGK